MVQLAAEHLPDGNAYWHPVFAVVDCDAAAARVTANGGSIVMGPETSPGVGRLAVAHDPFGAECVLLTPDENQQYAGWTLPPCATLPYPRRARRLPPRRSRAAVACSRASCTTSHSSPWLAVGTSPVLGEVACAHSRSRPPRNTLGPLPGIGHTGGMDVRPIPTPDLPVGVRNE